MSKIYNEIFYDMVNLVMHNNKIINKNIIRNGIYSIYIILYMDLNQ